MRSRARLSTRVALAGLLAALPTQGAARADDGSTDPAAVEPAETIVVTALAAPMNADALTSSVSVIPADRIEFSKYDNITDLLRHLPGVHMEQPGSRGGRSSIYLRGLDPNHTVILVDGIRLNDPNNNLGGSFDLSTLDTDNIERIEVVRGPLSAVHGSGALAGAINVITKTGKGGDQAILDVSGGRFGYARGLVVVRGQRGIFDATASGSFVEDGEPEADSRYRSANLHSSFGIELPKDARLRGTLRYVESRSRAYPEASGGEKFAVVRERDKRKSTEISMGLRLDQHHDSFRYELGIDYDRRREKRDVPPIAAPAGNPFAAVPAQDAHDLLYRTRVHADGTFEPIRGVSLTAGGDVTFENGNSLSNLDFGAGPVPGDYKQDRIVGGPFVEALLQTDLGLTVQAAIRADFVDDADDEWNPRVGASYAVPRTPLEVRGSWGRGFKLPAFFSLADPVIGNPDLDSEKSRGWDVGLDAVLWDGRIRASATYFEIRVENLIDFDFETFSLVNRDEVHSKGVELALSADLPWDLFFSAAVTRVRTNIENTRQDLRRRPRWRGSAGLQWKPHERVRLGLDALWVGSVFDESNPTGKVKLDDYLRFDFRGELLVWRDVSLYLAIDNLFDASYEEAVGVPAMGVRPRAGVRAVF